MLVLSDLPLSFDLIFFFNDTATTEIYTLSLHDALPISSAPAPPGGSECSTPPSVRRRSAPIPRWCRGSSPAAWPRSPDRKSTRLNSSHLVISYAVFCLKKKKMTKTTILTNVGGDLLFSA